MVASVVFSSGFKVTFVATRKVSCGEFRDCFTRCTNPQLVAKCEQILCMTSCEFDERAREVKMCCQSRPALCYSQQVDRARGKTRTACVQRNLKVISIKSHGKSLLFGYYKPGFNCLEPGAIIGDGDRKSWDPRGPMIWDNFSIFRTNCAILTLYIHARVVVSRVDVVTLRDQILRNC